MAVTRKDNKENLFVDNGASANTQSTHTQPKSIGFTGLSVIRPAAGSEYTNGIAKSVVEYYKTTPVTANLKVNVFDKEQFTNLAYSCIVVSQPNKANEVCYHITLLEATGREPMKASDIVAEATRAIRDPNTRPFIYTPDDAINGVLHNIITTELAKQYNTNKFISVEGLVLHHMGIDVNELGKRVGAIAGNAVTIEATLSSGELADINLAEAVDPKDNYRLETNLYHSTQTDLSGMPNRHDYKVDLVKVQQSVGFEFNEDSRQNILSVSGYIDAIREDKQVPQALGMPPVTVARFHPNIILTNNDVIYPTQGFMLLGVAASTIMAKPELWVQSLAAIDPASPNSVGSLNIIANIENNQNGQGTILDFSSKSVTAEEHQAAIRQIFSESPIISYDVQSYGHESYYNSVLAAAASPGNQQSKLEAIDEIIETCSQLTNGIFPADFPKSDIFVTSGVVVPMGYWMDKSGERDIRDIDAAFIANQTGDVNLVNKWNLTSLPRELTGLDPFLTRVEIINQLIPDAVINSKAVRVTFTNKFISALTSAIEAAGLSARYDAGIVINQQYNISQFTDYLAAAGLSTGPSFARQANSPSTGVFTNYTNMGTNRY